MCWLIRGQAVFQTLALHNITFRNLKLLCWRSPQLLMKFEDAGNLTDGVWPSVLSQSTHCQKYRKNVMVSSNSSIWGVHGNLVISLFMLILCTLGVYAQKALKKIYFFHYIRNVWARVWNTVWPLTSQIFRKSNLVVAVWPPHWVRWTLSWKMSSYITASYG